MIPRLPCVGGALGNIVELIQNPLHLSTCSHDDTVIRLDYQSLSQSIIKSVVQSVGQSVRQSVIWSGSSFADRTPDYAQQVLQSFALSGPPRTLVISDAVVAQTTNACCFQHFTDIANSASNGAYVADGTIGKTELLDQRFFCPS